MTATIHKAATGVLALVVLFATSGCDIFEARQPGRILPEDLNNRQSMQNLVTGMSSDFSNVFDETSFLVARASDEMAGSGSYSTTTLYARGILERQDVSFYWNAAHRARFNAEDGLKRMRKVLGDDFQGNPLTARAYLFAGRTNVLLGENFCQVAFDGSAAQPKSAAFQRAIPQLDSARQHASQAGRQDFETAATGAMAMANVGLGNWSRAAALASQVPTDFQWDAIYSTNSGREYNVWHLETHDRYESSAINTLAGSFSPPDPRAPYTDCSGGDGEPPPHPDCTDVNGADGNTVHYRQEKFPDLGDDMPAVNGQEMRMIEAEAALRNGNVDQAVSEMNEVRELYGLSTMDPDTISSSSTSFDASDQAWSILDDERHLALWLEGKRLWDLHRWDHPFLDGGSIVRGGVSQRASCIPIPQSECQTNENIDCG